MRQGYGSVNIRRCMLSYACHLCQTYVANDVKELIHKLHFIIKLMAKACLPVYVNGYVTNVSNV